MSGLTDLLDQAVMGFVKHVPGWAVAVVAIVFYPGLGLILPIALHWSTPQLVSANAIGVSGAALLTLGSFAAQAERARRRHLIEWTTDLRLLDAEEFEWFVGEVFRREGWGVRETGRQDSADGNIDLELTGNGERRIVQCKRWTSRWIGVDEIRNFAGTLLREGLPRGAGMFVTLSEFNQQARAEASTSEISLIDGRELYARAEKVRRPEPCSICHKPMLLGHSQHGWWLRCVTAGCKGKRDLGREPGRAIELLTEVPSSRYGQTVHAPNEGPDATFATPRR